MLADREANQQIDDLFISQIDTADAPGALQANTASSATVSLYGDATFAQNIDIAVNGAQADPHFGGHLF